ncbi:MAG: hypothetical protein ABI203_06145 [Mucilaginibacter sp.]
MKTNERATPINGKEGAEIKLNVAADWAKNHRERHPDGIISQFFGAEILQQILKQPGCMGIRIYYANSKKLTARQHEAVAAAHALLKEANAIGELHLLLTGVTSAGLDQIPTDGKVEVASAAAEPMLFKANNVASSIIAEQAIPCPGGAGCPKNSLTGEH